MSIWFSLSALGLLIAAYLHVKSVQHTKLKEKFGEEDGRKRGIILAKTSGWLESICLVGIWVSPQPTFFVSFYQIGSFNLFGHAISLIQIFPSIIFILLGICFGIRGLMEVGFEVADSHKIPNNLQTSGVYSYVRHPQYFGWFMAHIGFTILLSVQYSLLFTPVLFVIIYVISKAEERDLEEAFGDEYQDYKSKVPMLIPKIDKIIRRGAI